MDTSTLFIVGFLGLAAAISLLVAVGLQYYVSSALRQLVPFRRVAVQASVSFCLLLVAAAAIFAIYVIVT